MPDDWVPRREVSSVLSSKRRFPLFPAIRAVPLVVAACLLSCMSAFQQGDIEEFLDDGLSRKVVYNGNGNTGGAAPVAVVCRLATTVVVDSSGTLAKTDYDFSSWNTAANGSGASYAPGDSLTVPATDVTLYAQWAKRSPSPEPEPDPDPDPGVTIVDGSNLGSALAADPDGDFLLTEDVDTTVDGDWTPIGNIDTPFTGTFDGGGHTVTIVIGSAGSPSTVDVQGFFAKVGPEGVVRNLTLFIDNHFADPSIHHGGIVAHNEGLIEHCAVIGNNIQDLHYAGFIASGNAATGIIRECYAVGTVTGSWYTGGIVGGSRGVVKDCYSRITTSGQNWTGGIVGIVNATDAPGWEIKNCYVAGNVTGVSNFGAVLGGIDIGPGSITGCYYDNSFAGTDGNATGLSTTDMKNKASYAGWDFDTVWAIDGTGVINDGYPYLRYFGADTVTP